MNHQGQTGLNRPTDLLFKCLQLFLFELTTPIEVQSDLTNGNKSILAPSYLRTLVPPYLRTHAPPNFRQLLTPVGTYFLWMQANHGIEKIRILLTECQDTLRGW